MDALRGLTMGNAVSRSLVLPPEGREGFIHVWRSILNGFALPRLEGLVSVMEEGAVGDGVTDDSAAILRAEARAKQSDKILLFPWTANGYVIGDGSTNGTGFTPSSGMRYIGNGVKLINRAKNAAGQSRLFTVSGVSNVLITGFEIDGDDGVRQAVNILGTVENIWLHDLRLYDHVNFSVTYGGTVGATDDAFSNIFLSNIYVSGNCTVNGAAGIDFFPKTQDGSGVPVSRGLFMHNVYVDISRGETNTSNHGNTAVKINNTDGVFLSGIRTKGGDTAGLTITQGARHVRGQNIDCRYSDVGVIITQSGTNVTDNSVDDVKLSGVTYRKDGVTTSNAWGVEIQNGPTNVSVKDFNLDGDIYFKIVAGAYTSKAKHIKLLNGELIGSNIRVEDPGAASDPVTDLTVRDVKVSGGAGTGKGGISAESTNRIIDYSTFENITFDTSDRDCLQPRGSNNTIRGIKSVDGNPDNDSNRCVVRDEGNNNHIDDIQIVGTHHMKLFVAKTAGAGLRISGLRGTPETTRGFDLTGLESTEVPQGDILRWSATLDLSGAATDPCVLIADEDVYILGLSIVYTEASSADAGVVIRAGKLGTSTTTYLNVTSEVSKAVGYIKNYINTSGTDSFGTRKIAKGEALTIGTAGGKVGAGEVVVQVSLVRGMTP